MERLTPPTLSVIVANLERKGVLTRRPSARNARVRCLEPTELGRELTQRGLERVCGSLQALISQLTPGGSNRRSAPGLGA